MQLVENEIEQSGDPEVEEAEEAAQIQLTPQFLLVENGTGEVFQVSNYHNMLSKQIDSKDVLKPLKNERELSQEVDKLCQDLKDVQATDWKQRVKDLQRIQYFAQFYHDSGVANGTSTVSFHAFHKAVDKLVAPLAAQALDLRSSNAREAGISIQMLAEAMGDDFEQAAYKLMQKEGLIKVIHAGKTILAEVGLHAIVGILNNVCSAKVVQNLAQQCIDSKSKSVALYAGVFLYTIVTLYPPEQLLKLGSVLQQFMKHCIGNPNPECRSLARKSLLIWQIIDQNNAEQVYAVLDAAAQNAISSEEAQFQVQSMNGGDQHLLKPPPKRHRVSSRQGSRDTRMQKASPKPHGLGKKVMSSGSGNATPNRNQSRGKVRPPGTTGSAARLKSRGRIGSRQGTGNNQVMSTGPTSTGLQSQGSGEQPVIRTTMKDQKNAMTMSIGSNHSHSDNKVPQVPSAQRKGVKSSNLRRKSPTIETFVPEKKHNFAIDFYSKTNLAGENEAVAMKEEDHTNDMYAKQIGTGAKKQNQPQAEQFSYDDCFFRMKGYSMLQRNSALEDLMRHLVNINPEQVSAELNNKRSRFKQMAALIQERFARREDHSSFKAVEVQLDVIEFFFQTIPECLLEEVGPICLTLVACTQLNKQNISEKAYEILSIVKQVLTVELVLPHFLAAFDADKSNDSQYILEGLYFLHSLVDEATSLNEEAQFNAIIQTVANHLEMFMSGGKRAVSTQRHFELAALSVVLALRDKDLSLCMTAIQNVTQDQLKMIKQLATTFEKNLARQIDNVLRGKAQTEMQDAYRVSPRQGGKTQSYKGIPASEVLDSIMKGGDITHSQANSQMKDENEDVEEEMDVDSSHHRMQQEEESETQALRRKMELGRQMADDQKAEQLIQMADVGQYRQAQQNQPQREFQQQQQLKVNHPPNGQRRPRSGRGSKQGSGSSSRQRKQSPHQTQQFVKNDSQENHMSVPIRPAVAMTFDMNSNNTLQKDGQIDKIVPQRTSQKQAGFEQQQQYLQVQADSNMQKRNSAKQSALGFQSLSQLNDIIQDLDQTTETKMQAMHYIAIHPAEVFSDPNKLGFAFEKLVDSLIFHILKHSNALKDNGNDQMPKFGHLPSANLQLSNASFDLLTVLTSLTPFNHEFSHLYAANNNPNCPPGTTYQQFVDTSSFLDRESMNAAPLTLREKLIRSILHTYSPNVPQQHQTFANQKAEDLLRSIAHNTNLNLIGGTAATLLMEQEPPRLQAVLRMTESRIKSFNVLTSSNTIEFNQDDFNNLISCSKALAHQLSNTVPDVRKTVVFCLIEVCDTMGVQNFNKEVMEPLLNVSQQRLVQIYIDRRSQQSQNRQ